MKKIILALALTALAPFVQAQSNPTVVAGNIASGFNLYTVATLPAAAPNYGMQFTVTDLSVAGQCATGGGSVWGNCISNGTAWVTGGGATPVGSSGQCLYNASGVPTGIANCTSDGTNILNMTYTGSLTATQGTITNASPMLTGTVTVNNAAVPFWNIDINTVNSASDATSGFLRFRNNGTQKVYFDFDGNLTLAGSLSTCTACATATLYDFKQGTDNGAPGTGVVRYQAPTSITAYRVTIPGVAATGVMHWTNTAGSVVETPSTVTLAEHATQAADTVVLNASGSSAAPTAVAMPTSGTNGCAGAANALTYNTSTHALGCNTISAGTPPSYPTCVLFMTSTNTVWTNQPLAETKWNSVPAYQYTCKVDLTNATQVRMNLSVITGSASANTPILYAKYVSGDATCTTAVGSWSTFQSNGASLTTAGLITTAWENIPAGAKGDVCLALYGSGGDGTADPAIWSAVLQFK